MNNEMIYCQDPTPLKDLSVIQPCYSTYVSAAKLATTHIICSTLMQLIYVGKFSTTQLTLIPLEFWLHTAVRVDTYVSISFDV